MSSLILNGSPGPAAARHIPTLVIPEGTNIVVLTSNSIQAGSGSSGQLYPATIQQDVIGSSGTVAIPAGTHAKLVVSNVRGGGAVRSPDLVLDLYSIDVHGEEYRVDSSSVTESNKSGLGPNRRTAEWTGGGAGLGALMGAVFGGGKYRRPCHRAPTTPASCNARFSASSDEVCSCTTCCMAASASCAWPSERRARASR